LPFTGTTNSSTYAGSFNGSNQSLTVPTSSQFSFSGDFTWEAWVNFSAFATNQTQSIICSRGAGASDSAFQVLVGDTSGVKNFGATISVGSTDTNFFPTIPQITTGTWNHYAIVRSGTTVTVYVNGIAYGSATVSGTTNTPSVAPSIGVRGGSYNDLRLNGYISNLRLVGSAVYASNFTPPTSALTAISGTRLLTLQNATIIDNSTNAFTITNNNSVTTTVQYPYVVTAFLDKSPAGNNWTPNNISGLNGSTYDFMTDVPTLTSATVANYAVCNPLGGPSGGLQGTLSNGNLTWTSPGTDQRCVLSTMPLNSNATSKWYWEVTATSKSSTYWAIGIFPYNINQYGATSAYAQYRSDGNIYVNGSVATTVSGYGAGSVIGLAFDSSNNQLSWYLNGTLQTTQTVSNSAGYLTYAGAGSDSSGNSNVNDFNFGQQPFAYTPPSGFVALNTYNL
jgi:hypothetical protein